MVTAQLICAFCFCICINQAFSCATEVTHSPSFQARELAVLTGIALKLIIRDEYFDSVESGYAQEPHITVIYMCTTLAFYKWFYLKTKQTFKQPFVRIMLTCPCNVDTFIPHFYRVKLGFTQYTLFSYLCLKTWIVGTR